MRNTGRWFALAVGALVIAHPFLGPGGRAWTYLISVALSIPPTAAALRRTEPGARLPFGLLLASMATLTAGGAVNAFGGPDGRGAVEGVISLGHALLLAAAVALVLRRGRNDMGGVLDVSVVAVAVGGVVWTTLVSPELGPMAVGLGTEIAMLISVLVLAGVLGALLRLWLEGARLPALGLLLAALSVALVGNTYLARTTGAMTTGRSGDVELLFMIAFGCVGLAMLHPSAAEMLRPGRAPEDRLSPGRLVFLGFALVVGPVAGGLRGLTDLGADGALLAGGSLLVTPLVMIRVGLLARQHRQAEEQLRHQASHDLLTGLPNRAELLRRLEGALERERAAGQPSVVLLFIDLNGFKQVNDRLGHVAGDDLLVQVGARIRAGLRSGDTLARYGGDEFLMLCSDRAQDAAATRLAGHVERSLAEPFRLAGEDVVIGASVGSVLSAGVAGADELISRADEAMYRAKQAVPVRGGRSVRR